MAKKTRRQLFGQHFLHERRILQKIIEAIKPEASDLILEIGPGKGVLTFPLVEKAGKVVAIEKDYALVKFLEEKRIPNLKIIAGDILAVSPGKIIKEENQGKKYKSVKLVGNLPYHISTQILFVLLELKKQIERAVFLFQKEVAERIVAAPGNKNYAPLSILLQNYFDCRILFFIKPGAFSPPPRVSSACLAFYPRPKPLIFSSDQEEKFYEFLRSCFHQRRKTLIKNLEISGYNKENLTFILNQMNLQAKIRAEELNPQKLFEVFQAAKSLSL
ncbi:MAG TPA: ribosomal RNA small subunit methyltransferase A [Candidatus Aminicenantes bacterium]|nr:MAG: ribosomal RNA small subunit methyltransferase A [Candidatus Aminicenantes bacterium]HEK85065.1 ribosomal RNA small subunit methyltransferase A [Candidatus Aminicenantes bacterium]